MKARVLFLLVLLASAGAVSATPDRAVHVVEQLVGFRGDAMVVRQLVRDNLGSHYQAHIQVWLVERLLSDNGTLSRHLLADYRESTLDGLEFIDGGPDEHLAEVLAERPDLFHDIEYAFPAGNQDGRSVIGGEVVWSAKGEELRLDLAFRLPELAAYPGTASVLQSYYRAGFLILLVDFGCSCDDTDYRQRIVALPLVQ
ncbi:MAG: hypothetical protein JXA15_10490 [Spirochaetales bacterium]|nr:hypothetical protein [Spirochaetales bacterium]